MENKEVKIDAQTLKNMIIDFEIVSNAAKNHIKSVNPFFDTAVNNSINNVDILKRTLREHVGWNYI